MPYTLETLPKVIKELDSEAQKIWLNAFNDAYNSYKKNDQIATQVAWAALKKAGYYKNADGKWVKG
jgi:cation transport regulator ChaB